MKTRQPRIVCGTDFSANAREAADVAAILAQRAGATLELVHVADPLNLGRNDPDESDNLVEPAERRLALEGRRLTRAGVEVGTRLLRGGPAEKKLASFLARDPPELLVVSSVSKTTFNRWTVGSVSETLAESSPEPVLVVRDAGPFVAWQRGERKLRIFAAIDLSPGCASVLRWLAGFAALGPCEATLGFVARTRTRAFGPGLTVAEKARCEAPRPLRSIRQELADRARPILGEFPFALRVRLADGAADLPLLEMAKKASADLFVVGTHQWQGLGRVWHPSVSRSILRHAPISVACLPAAGGPEPSKSGRP